VDRAVAAAADRHRAGPLPAWERAEVLDRAATAVADRREELARTISAESAKPIGVARTEVDRATSTFRFAAVAARTLAGEQVPMDASAAGAGMLGFTLRVPRGVVAAITPFNFPLNLVAHKVAPAIAAGCPVVCKPASATPLTALALARLLEEEAGLPPGWCNVVTVPGAQAERLATHEDVAAVSFTGSADVGWALRERAPRKHVALELGNNAPVIVEADADLADAAARLAAGGTSFSGQSCISVQRVYAHEDVADELLERLVAAMEALVVGDPADDDTQVSSLIDRGARERVAGLVDDAVADGAVVATGHHLDDHGVYLPTVVAGVTPAMDVVRTEVFGPVIGVARHRDLDEAIALANDTTFGLQAGIFTRSIGAALDAAHRLDFGGVTVNEVPTFRADQMPYGGERDSGNTREGPQWAVRELTTERMVVIRR
jgi:acyl-CoA reductase-like NAD-dependent aldehyde dehydrogenase